MLFSNPDLIKMFFTIIPSDAEHKLTDCFIREKLTTLQHPLNGIKHSPGDNNVGNKCTVHLIFKNRKLKTVRHDCACSTD